MADDDLTASKNAWEGYTPVQEANPSEEPG